MPGADVSPALTEALQAALAGEHAAVWAAGRAAAELPSAQRAVALDELDAHREARDALRAQVIAAGAAPQPAAPAYREPFRVRGASTARRLLALVNDRLAATYADLAAASPPGTRTPAIDASVSAARRAIAWGGQPHAFPGSD